MRTAEQRHPVFTVADTILWLSEDVDRNSATRKLRAVKVRGRSPMPGLHTFRLTDAGMQVFPRIPEQQRQRVVRRNVRLATGVPGLDEMTGGGIPAGDVVLLTGPAGSGKTTFATHFIAQGLSDGESCVVAVFEEYPESYLARAKTVSIDLDSMVDGGRLAITYLRPLDLSVDEMLAEIQAAVERVGATRVVIDSLSGFEVALAPTYRADFRESLYRLVGALTATGVTVLMTDEVVDANPGGRFTHERVSFITDDIIVQRYVEIDGQAPEGAVRGQDAGERARDRFPCLLPDVRRRRHGRVALGLSRDHDWRSGARGRGDRSRCPESRTRRSRSAPMDSVVQGGLAEEETPAAPELIRQRAITEQFLLSALRARDASDEAVAASHRATFLAAASRELAVSLDDETVRERIRRRALPREGSWCIVDVVEFDGAVHRLPVAHPDSARQGAAELFADRWFPSPPPWVPAQATSGSWTGTRRTAWRRVTRSALAACWSCRSSCARACSVRSPSSRGKTTRRSRRRKSSSPRTSPTSARSHSTTSGSIDRPGTSAKRRPRKPREVDIPRENESRADDASQRHRRLCLVCSRWGSAGP